MSDLSDFTPPEKLAEFLGFDMSKAVETKKGHYFVDRWLLSAEIDRKKQRVWVYYQNFLFMTVDSTDDESYKLNAAEKIHELYLYK